MIALIDSNVKNKGIMNGLFAYWYYYMIIYFLHFKPK